MAAFLVSSATDIGNLARLFVLVHLVVASKLRLRLVDASAVLEEQAHHRYVLLADGDHQHSREVVTPIPFVLVILCNIEIIFCMNAMMNVAVG